MKRKLNTFLLAICMIFSLCQPALAVSTVKGPTSTAATYMAPQDAASKFFRYRLSAIDGNAIYLSQISPNVYAYTSTLVKYTARLNNIRHGASQTTGFLDIGGQTVYFTYNGNLPLNNGALINAYGYPQGYTDYTYEVKDSSGRIFTKTAQCTTFRMERYIQGGKNITLSEAEKIYYSGEYVIDSADWYGSNTSVYIDLHNNTIDGIPFTFCYPDEKISRTVMLIPYGLERIRLMIKMSNATYDPRPELDLENDIWPASKEYYCDTIELYANNRSGTIRSHRAAARADTNDVRFTNPSDISYFGTNTGSSNLPKGIAHDERFDGDWVTFPDGVTIPVSEKGLEEWTKANTPPVPNFSQSYGHDKLTELFPEYNVMPVGTDNGRWAYALDLIPPKDLDPDTQRWDSKRAYVYLDPDTGKWNDSEAPRPIPDEDMSNSANSEESKEVYTYEFGFATLEAYFPGYVIDQTDPDGQHPISKWHCYSITDYQNGGKTQYYKAYLNKITGEWDDSKAPGPIDEAVG